MEKTKMTAAQVTIWFTNARVKLRKEKKLAVKVNGKKQKKNEHDDLHELKKILELSFSSDEETSDSVQWIDKTLVIAYSCLNNEQIVGQSSLNRAPRDKSSLLLSDESPSICCDVCRLRGTYRANRRSYYASNYGK
jgi:hypothetical protein